MQRLWPLSFLLAVPLYLFLASGCESKDNVDKAGPAPNANGSHGPRPTSATSATRGLPSFLKAYKEWAPVVNELEETARAGGNGGPTERELNEAIKNLKIYVAAAQLGLNANTRQSRVHRLGYMREEEAKIEQRVTMEAGEIQELTQLLERIEKGTEGVPRGRTVAELQDLRADRERDVQKLREDQAAITQKAGELHARIESNDPTIEEDSLWARHVEEWKALLARAERLKS